MTYAYIRVSTKGQCIDRQYEELKSFNINKKIFLLIKNQEKTLKGHLIKPSLKTKER